MAGRDESARLQGLLSGIAGDVGELGKGGEWAGNAIRTVARPDFMAGSDKVLGKYGRPEFDMNNVDNLNAMANWASRNGYEDQAKNYMLMSQTLDAEQQKKKYETATAQDTQKLRGMNSAIAGMNTKHSAMTAADVRDSSVGPMPNAQLENLNVALLNADRQRSSLVQSMNDRGSASRYGNGVEGDDALRLIAKEDAVLRKAQGEEADAAIARRDARADWAARIEQSKQAPWETFQTLGLSKRDYDTYREGYANLVNTLSEQYGPDHPTYIGRLAEYSSAKLEAYKGQGERNITAVKAVAPTVGARALTGLVKSLDTQKGMGWLGKLATDQADALTWLQDSDNSALINQVMTSAASTVLLMNPELKGQPAELDKAVRDEFINQMSTVSAEFAEEYTEDVLKRAENRAGADARTAIENMGDGYGKESGRAEFLDSQAARFAQDLPNADPSEVTADWVRENHNDLWQEWNDTFTRVWKEKYPEAKSFGAVPDGSGMGITIPR